MSRFFARAGSKPLSDEQPRTSSTHNFFHRGEHIRHVRVAILGTGFSGLGMAIQLKQSGQDNFVVIERAGEIGGTWRDNIYPGCACDVQSHLYSFSFAPNPHWSRLYSSQKEIRAYLRRCARQSGILPHIQWNCELQNASWDDHNQGWYITTSQGQFTTDILILGNGPLSEPSLPAIPGITSFEGTLFHSARWRYDYDLTGKRVAVIGTGASAIQFVPHIQPQVSQLSLFQRTPPWILPRLDHAIPPSRQTLYSLFPILQRAGRTKMYWLRELTAYGLVYKPAILKSGIRMAQQHLQNQVPDPLLRAKLTPNYMMGCKRILLSDDFYPTLSQPNVELVTTPIREVRASSIITQDGREHEVDTLICATGFHVTDTRLPQYIHGRDGQSLADNWSATGPKAYLGTTVTGFPNLFLLIGPGTGLGHSSMILMIESQIAYILDCMHVMAKRDLSTVELQPAAQEAFYTEMQQRMQGTVWTSGCSSWYLDAQGHNTTLWPGFTFEFRRRTRHFDVQNYNLIPSQSSIHAALPVIVDYL